MENSLPSFKRTLAVFIVLLCSIQSVYAQNWNQILKSVAGDRQDKTNAGRSYADNFGYSVAISGTYAIVGTPNEDEDEVGANFMENSGAAYLFYNNAGTWKKVKKLVASNRFDLGKFGSSVAINGDYIVIGAPDDSYGPFMHMGSAYIFKKDQGGTDNWGEVKKITAANRSENDLFGSSVSISNDYVIVGAYKEDQDSQESVTVDDSGCAYIFKKDFGRTENWGLTQKITAALRAPYDYFGFSVAIDGDMAVVGSYQDDDDLIENNPLDNSGSGYIFIKDVGSEHWTLTKKITASIRSALDQFGYSVAISGDNVIVGAIGDDDRSSTNATYTSGAAYIFSKNYGGIGNWGQVKKMISFDRQEGDLFGYCVSISGNCAVAGTRSEGRDNNNNRTYAGSANIFVKDKDGADQWGFTKKINPYFRTENTSFGNAVSVHGNYILAGAMNEVWDGVGGFVTASGSAHVFYNAQISTSNWSEQQQLAATTGTYGSSYGGPFSVDGQYALVGAHFDGEKSVGAAYVLQNISGKWTQIKKLVPDVQQENGYFGTSLAISGDYAVVGAYGTNSFVGVVYIFKKDQGGSNNWGLLRKITAPERIRFFGQRVSISGENILIGTDIDLTTSAGSAHIYTKNFGGNDNWGYFQKILPPLPNPQAYFGSSVGISGDTLIIGAPNEEILSSGDYRRSGAAYIFARNTEGTWQQVKRIVASDRIAGDSFGTSVYLNAGYVFVGDPYDNRDANGGGTVVENSGSVYIFKRTTNVAGDWLQVKKITAPVRSNNANFGISVGISGNYAVIGSYGESDLPSTSPQSQSGAAYILKNDGGINNWIPIQRIQSSLHSAGDLFGMYVAINGKYIFVSATHNAADASEQNLIFKAGAAYIFMDNTPLPVTISSFEAKKVESQAILNWTTISETNSDYFEIQKSSDGISWEGIGTIAAAEESEKFKTYTFIDNKPYGGENLYRLKMVDRDAAFAYSTIRNLSFDGLGISVFPNPVSDKIFFTQSELPKIKSVEILNVEGKILLQNAKISEEGISISHLISGMYLVKIKKVDGTIQTNKIFIVR